MTRRSVSSFRIVKRFLQRRPFVTTLTIRWFLPVCLFRGHEWMSVEAATAFDWSGRSCARCGTFEPCLCNSYENYPERTPCAIHPEIARPVEVVPR